MKVLSLSILTSCFIFVESLLELQIARFALVYQDDKVADLTELRIKKFNNSRAIGGDFELHEAFNNDFEVAVKVYKQIANGEFHLYRNGSPKPLCDFLLNEGKKFYEDVANGSNLPNFETIRDTSPDCFPAKTYKAHGILLHLENFPKTFRSSSDYAYEMIFSKGDEIILKYRVFTSVQ